MPHNSVRGFFRKERDVPLVCQCCQWSKPDVKERRAHVQSSPRLLCDACWADPALAYRDCKHGEAP